MIILSNLADFWVKQWRKATTFEKKTYAFASFWADIALLCISKIWDSVGMIRTQLLVIGAYE